MSDLTGLKRRLRQQQVVAELGQSALETSALDTLMHEACVAVADTLNNEYSKVLERLPGGDALFLREGVGWRDGLVGSETVPTDRDSQAGYTLIREEPVIVEDLRSESRFSGPELLTNHDVVSGISVIIGSVEEPWGVLGTHSTDPGTYTDHDAAFVQSVANVLASAIDRIEREHELSRFRLLTEAAKDVIVTIDEESVIQSINPAVKDRFGYHPEELIGSSLTRLMPEDLAHQHGRGVDQYLETGERTVDWEHFETVGERADGTRIPLSISFGVTEFADGAYFTGVIRDLSERKRQQRETERLLDLLTHAGRIADVGGWEIDHETRDVHVSDHLFEILGLTDEDELELDDALAVFDGEDRDLVATAIEAALEEGEPIDVKARFERSDGEIRWLHIVGEAETEDGEVRSLRGAAQDITERKNRERALAESHERLEEFATAVSHDLREPLGTVASYLQLLERRYEEDLDEDAQEFIEFAVSGATRTREMIDGLLTTYAHVENTGDPIDSVDLEAVLGDVLIDLEEKITRSDAEITADALPVVRGERGQVRQLMMNLIDNAIKYSGDERPRVHVTAERDAGMHHIAVSDEGIGMDPAAADRAFEVFSRLHHTDDVPGTGIGLALCERIVERHDGEIWVETEPGEGSTFTVTLPPAESDEG